MNRAPHGPLERARRRRAIFAVLPVLATLALLAGWPLARTLWFSFTDASLADPARAHFVGALNYALLAGDVDWWRAVRNTLVFALGSVALETGLGIAFALVLNRPFPGRWIVAAAVLVPWAVPTVVAARLWAWMLNDLYGVVNAGLLAAGLAEEPVPWLGPPALAMASAILVDAWKTTPFVALLVLAGLRMIPEEVYEAARVDGAGAWRTFRQVTLPLAAPAIAVAVLFRILDALRVFDAIFVLLGEGRGTMSVSIFARQHLIAYTDAGYGSAAASAVFVMVAAVAGAYLTAVRARLLEAAR